MVDYQYICFLLFFTLFYVAITFIIVFNITCFYIILINNYSSRHLVFNKETQVQQFDQVFVEVQYNTFTFQLSKHNIL